MIRSEDFAGTFHAIANKNEPFSYQQTVAEALFRRRNLVVTAPTGAGKTFAVLAPFLCNREAIGVRRLIYVLPLRTLAQGVLHEARTACKLARPDWNVTIQTGEQPDDPFFDLGDIIVTTYDQLLSGFLCQPYGKSAMQYNMNAASVWGNLVVFDEFHLMDVDKAFVTAVSCMELFRESSRSVWMTATATKPLKEYLAAKLNALDVQLSEEELRGLLDGRRIQRSLRRVDASITAKDVLASPEDRTLVVMNQVKRAQQLFEELVEEGKKVSFDTSRIVLLHARFFASDREKKRQKLYELFGKNARGPAIAVATQVVEAGLDLSATKLMTEICPMSALVQRAGRCARFPGQSGTVLVFQTSGDHRPYDKKEVTRTWETLRDVDQLGQTLVDDWVNQVHQQRDSEVLSQSGGHLAKCIRHISGAVTKTNDGGVAEFIREGSDSIRLIVHDSPTGRPAEWESIPVYRSTLQFLKTDLASARLYDPVTESWTPASRSEDIFATYVVALGTDVAKYTTGEGLQLGKAGRLVSPARVLAARESFSLKRESWKSHSQSVWQVAEQHLKETFVAGFIGQDSHLISWLHPALQAACLLHDLGKLQDRWQAWAEKYERQRDSEYRHVESLAHTTFDSSKREDRERSKDVGFQRPKHSTASAVYSLPLLTSFFPGCPVEVRAMIILSIVSHHGGWFNSKDPILPLTRTAESDVLRLGQANGFPAPAKPVRWTVKAADLDRCKTCFLPVLEEFERLWPITALLMRSLRLADRKATRESSANE